MMRYEDYAHTDESGRRRSGTRRWSPSRVRAILYVALLGVLTGSQIFDPSKRFLEAIVGLVIVGLVWSFKPIAALWMILILYPFPFAISVGNSTFVFVLVIFIIYMVRTVLRQVNFRGDALVNLPVGLLVFTYIISFYNQNAEGYQMRFALQHTANFFAILLLYYILVNSIEDEAKLRKTMAVFLVSTAFIVFFTLLELMFPGRVLLPNVVYSTHRVSLIMKDIRVGGPFHDYELLAEFFAMNVPLIIFMLVRTRRLLYRAMYVALLFGVLGMQFATITRGAFVSLMIGLLYMAFICRKDLNVVTFTGFALGFVGAMFLIDLIMARYTVSGSLFTRLLGTTFEQGVIPETRVASWSGAVERWLQHPIIGNGPGWDFTHNIEAKLWPHNGYLYYLNITGIFGLAAFLLLLYRLVRASVREVGHSLARSPFAVGLMKVLHVSLVIFIVDTTKTDYLRNFIYMYFVWIFFALISATRKIIDASGTEASPGARSAV